MSRREIRENLFCVLFRTEFHIPEELMQQATLYFDMLEKPLNSEETDIVIERFQLILKNMEEIDNMLEKVSKGWRLNRMGKVDLTILRLAAFEMFYDNDIPVSVAINEAVELAKKYGEDHSSSFINGLLGKLSRQAEHEENEIQKESESI